jgi:hypothetical protein
MQDNTALPEPADLVVAPKNIHQCLATIMFSVDEIKKGKENKQQGFMYRGIDDIMNALHNLFAIEGVVISVSKIVTVERVERTTAKGSVMLYSINDYQFRFSAPDGSSLKTWSRGEANDTADKSSNKAVSVALKYCLLQMFLIPTEEMAKNEADAYANELGAKPKPAAKPAPTYARPEDISSAISLINTAKDLPALADIWKSIHPTTKNAPGVLPAKDAMKAKLSPPRKEPAE